MIVGTTGSGKSHLARRLARSAARQGPLLIIDPAGSSLTDLPGAVTFSDPTTATNHAGAQWARARIARFVPHNPYDLDAYDAVYRWAWQARTDEGTPAPRFIWCDEAGMVLPARGAPKGGGRVLVQGRKRQLGHLACHTRPRDIHRDLIAQTQHLAIFALPNIDDRRHIAELAGIPAPQLETAMAALGPYEFLWWSIGRPLRHCAPLPPT